MIGFPIRYPNLAGSIGRAMRFTDAIRLRLPGIKKFRLRPDLSARRRNARMASGLILFAYVTAHLVNHALGVISLGAAEVGLRYAVMVWNSLPGSVLLYSAAFMHFMLAL